MNLGPLAPLDVKSYKPPQQCTCIDQYIVRVTDIQTGKTAFLCTKCNKEVRSMVRLQWFVWQPYGIADTFMHIKSSWTSRNTFTLIMSISALIVCIMVVFVYFSSN